MKIKGHSTIELKNIRTGETEKYEDDNIVTKALAYYLQDLGAFNISPLISDNTIKNHPIEQLLGGLLIFDSNITENVNQVTCPAGPKMVGNGSYNVTANGEDDVTELGSWNSTESGWMSDGSYKMVWDFATTQANGDINCVCLTSADHGYIGEGNSTSESKRSTIRHDTSHPGTVQEVKIDYSQPNNPNYESRRYVRGSYADSTVTLIDLYNLIYTTGHEDEHMSVTGKIKLVTYKVPLSKFDMRMSIPANTNSGQGYIPENVTEIDIPAGFLAKLKNRDTNYRNVPYFCRNGKYYYMVLDSGRSGVWGNMSLDASDSFEVLRINPDNTVNTYTLPCPVSNGLFAVYPYTLCFGTDCMVYVGMETNSSSKIIYQNFTTPADVTVILDNLVYTDATSSGAGYNDVDNNRAIIRDYCIDMENRTAYKCNTLFYVGGSSALHKTVSLLDDNPLNVNCDTENQTLWTRFYRTTNYLATINNLSEQVTKTAEKTMKVTYIIRFTDEEESE